MRFVLDTNVLVAALGWKGPPRDVVKCIREEEHTLITSAALLTELSRVLTYPKLSWIISQPSYSDLSSWLFQPRHMVLPREHLTVIVVDPSDDRVLEAAVAGQADYIVSGDQHLLKLGSFRGIPIVSPRQFLEEDTRRR